jgi:hypothetical protein
VTSQGHWNVQQSWKTKWTFGSGQARARDSDPQGFLFTVVSSCDVFPLVFLLFGNNGSDSVIHMAQENRASAHHFQQQKTWPAQPLSLALASTSPPFNFKIWTELTRNGQTETGPLSTREKSSFPVEWGAVAPMVTRKQKMRSWCLHT